MTPAAKGLLGQNDKAATEVAIEGRWPIAIIIKKIQHPLGETHKFYESHNCISPKGCCIFLSQDKGKKLGTWEHIHKNVMHLHLQKMYIRNLQFDQV